jgi:hypothetical protein
MKTPSAKNDTLALELKAAYEELSPLIEAFTAEVCPTCEKVCCIDRHGTHEEADLFFLAAACEDAPPEPPLEDDTLPCRHLGKTGCSIERWRRPYRCTWYFCPALLEAMPPGDPRGYRELVAKLEKLGELRHRLIDEQTVLTVPRG